MRKLFERLSPRRLDEMEQQILFKAQRNAYLFLVAALIVWTLYESWQVFRTGARVNLLPCLLLVIAVNIQSLTQLVLTRRAVRDDPDSLETGPLAGIVLLCCAVAGAAAVVTASVLMLGARL